MDTAKQISGSNQIKAGNQILMLTLNPGIHALQLIIRFSFCTHPKIGSDIIITLLAADVQDVHAGAFGMGCRWRVNEKGTDVHIALQDCQIISADCIKKYLKDQICAI